MLKIKISLISMVVLICGTLILSGCTSSKFSIGPNQSKFTPTPTLIVLLTEVANGYPAVSDRSCLLANYVPITTNKSQGDLMAWSPSQDPYLAFVGPENNTWSWYLGAVNIVNPAAKKQIFASSNIKVFGDLAWAPDGKSLAFVTLQSAPQEDYSVSVLKPENGQITDLFPSQGQISSPNAILKEVEGWDNSQTVVVAAACGLDCSQLIQFNTDGTGKHIVKEQRQVDDHSLDLTVNLPDFDVNAFPKMNLPNWSPDKKWIVYSDDDDQIWVLNLDGKYQYLLGWLGDLVRESKWSSDSSMVAFRMDNQIKVYKVGCK